MSIEKVYPQLAGMGERLRGTIERAFSEEGIYVRCTGSGNEAISGSSFAFIHFPYREETKLLRPEDLFDPAVCDVDLRRDVLQLALLMENVHLVHGRGAISTSHTEEDMERLGQAFRQVARRVKTYL